MSTQTIERTTLTHLIHNENYCRKVIPFIKSEYFANRDERVVFEEIEKFQNFAKQNNFLINNNNLILLKENNDFEIFIAEIFGKQDSLRRNIPVDQRVEGVGCTWNFDILKKIIKEEWNPREE